MPHVVPTHQFSGKPKQSTQVGAIISQSDLDRIRGNTKPILQSEEELRQTLRQTEKDRDAIARQRQQKTKQGDMERSMRQQPTEYEKILTIQSEALNNQATRARVEGDDIAKIMNTLELQAKTFAVRDRQVVISQRAGIDEQLQKQKEHEKNMEDLRKFKEQEELKLQAQLREREMLKQHAEMEAKRKERVKLLEEEAKLREAEEYKTEYQRQMEHQRQKFIEKQEEIKRCNEETTKINAEVEKKRLAILAQEQKLDLQIKEQQIQNEAKFHKEVKAKQEKEKQQMNEFWQQEQDVMQQNMVDKEIQDARDYAAREKEERAFLQRKAEMEAKKRREYQESLQFEKQSTETKAMKKHQNCVEQARELQKIKQERQQWQLEQIEKNQKKMLDQVTAGEDFQKQLLEKQAMVQLTDPKLDKEKYLSEQDKRMAMLEALKQEKIAKLKAANVDPKYIRDLQNLNIESLIKKQ